MSLNSKVHEMRLLGNKQPPTNTPEPDAIPKNLNYIVDPI